MIVYHPVAIQIHRPRFQDVMELYKLISKLAAAYASTHMTKYKPANYAHEQSTTRQATSHPPIKFC
jgi:hypothetical protein